MSIIAINRGSPTYSPTLAVELYINTLSITDDGYVLADGEFNRDTIYYSIVIDDILGETYKNAFATSANYLY